MFQWSSGMSTNEESLNSKQRVSDIFLSSRTIFIRAMPTNFSRVNEPKVIYKVVIDMADSSNN